MPLTPTPPLAAGPAPGSSSRTRPRISVSAPILPVGSERSDAGRSGPARLTGLGPRRSSELMEPVGAVSLARVEGTAQRDPECTPRCNRAGGVQHGSRRHVVDGDAALVFAVTAVLIEDAVGEGVAAWAVVKVEGLAAGIGGCAIG